MVSSFDRYGWSALGFLFLFCVCCLTEIRAEQPSADDIVRALKPATTELGSEGLKTRTKRGVSVQTGAEAGIPSIDLYINFKYDSAELEPDALLTLRSLGQALRTAELRDARIQIVGHTDAKGADAYNQTLSERRAVAVRSVLIGMYDIDTRNLDAIGRGRSELKDKDRPEDGINRRVEIRNITK